MQDYKFIAIDYDNWDRREIYETFSADRTSYTMTVDLDITALIATIKRFGRKFYPTITYLIAKVINSRSEYRCAIIEGVIGYYDRVDPLYTLMRTNSTLFTHTVTAFNSDFCSFYDSFERDRVAAENCGRLYYRCEGCDNALCISITPTVTFKHLAFNYQLASDGSLVPFVVAGKYYTSNDKILLPVMGDFRHEVNDGYHSALFYELLQSEIDSFCL